MTTPELWDLVEAVGRWIAAKEREAGHHDLKGDIQLEVRAAERDLEDAWWALDAAGHEAPVTVASGSVYIGDPPSPAFLEDRPTGSLIVESPGSKTVEGRLDEPKPGLGTQRELLNLDREMVAGKDGVTPFSTFTVERRDRKTGRHVRYQHVPVVGLTDTYVTVDLTNAGLVTVLSEGT